jgi:hypothetical protein
MKASKFTDAQKAFIIRQGEDGTPVEEICREVGDRRKGLLAAPRLRALRNRSEDIPVSAASRR